MNRTFVDPGERFFEDFAVGDVVDTRGRTVDAADLIRFAALTGDQPGRIDDRLRRPAAPGARVAQESLTQCFAIGLVVMSGWFGTAVAALLEIKSVRPLKPVLAGETIRARAEVTAAEPGTSARFGALEVHYSVLDGAADDVMVFDQSMLATRRTAA